MLEWQRMVQSQESLPEYELYKCQTLIESGIRDADIWLRAHGTICRFLAYVILYQLRCQRNRQLRLQPSGEETLEEPRLTWSRLSLINADNNRIKSFNELNLIYSEKLKRVILGSMVVIFRLEPDYLPRLHDSS